MLGRKKVTNHFAVVLGSADCDSAVLDFRTNSPHPTTIIAPTQPLIRLIVAMKQSALTNICVALNLGSAAANPHNDIT